MCAKEPEGAIIPGVVEVCVPKNGDWCPNPKRSGHQRRKGMFCPSGRAPWWKTG